MKKIVYVIVTALILSVFLCVPSFAADERVITFSEDFRTMYYRGLKYYQKNLTGFEAYCMDYGEPDEFFEYDVYEDEVLIMPGTGTFAPPCFANYSLSETQKEIVDSVNINGDDIIALVDVEYKDGTTLSLNLLREDYVDDYELLLSGKIDNYMVDFEWPEGNIINVNKAKLFENEAAQLRIRDYWEYDSKLVYINSADGNLTYTVGILLDLNDSYFYVDLEESGYNYNGGAYLFLDNVSVVSAHEITDETILADIVQAEEKYYADEYGYLENDKLANTISFFFLILLFGIIPGIIFIVSLVFAFIKKKIYRKLLIAVSFFTLAEIIVFIIFMVLANFK